MLGWMLKVGGGQEVGKGRGKNRHDQSSLGTRMKFSIKEISNKQICCLLKKSSKISLNIAPPSQQ